MVEMVAAKHGDLPEFRCYASYFPEADNDRPLLESYDLLPLGVIRRGRAPCRCTVWVSSMRSGWSATSHQSQRPQFGMCGRLVFLSDTLARWLRMRLLVYSRRRSSPKHGHWHASASEKAPSGSVVQQALPARSLRVRRTAGGCAIARAGHLAPGSYSGSWVPRVMAETAVHGRIRPSLPSTRRGTRAYAAGFSRRRTASARTLTTW